MAQIKQLTEPERGIFEAIENGAVEKLKTLLVGKRDVNILDENFMTPLQHACYKGNKEMVQMLLDQGADVNLCEHKHSYTALHFAGLSGNTDVCHLLLLAGAKSQVTNSVGRTPSQMAAFVGNHSCVAIINNFVPKSDIDYYTRPQGQQTMPYLQPFLADSLHKLIMHVNVHPMRVAINIHKYAGLPEHLPEIKKVLEMMSTKEMKRGPETNEVMAFKFHYLSYVVSEIDKIRQRQNRKGDSDKTDDNKTNKDGGDASSDEKKADPVDLFARKILKEDKNGILTYLDAFLREGIREFPYRECTMFRQMVASLAGDSAPAALNVVTAAINGQRGFQDDVPICSTCGEEKPAKKCSKCKIVQYCDRNCQRYHWFMHKKACKRSGHSNGVIQDSLENP